MDVPEPAGGSVAVAGGVLDGGPVHEFPAGGAENGVLVADEGAGEAGGAVGDRFRVESVAGAEGAAAAVRIVFVGIGMGVRGTAGALGDGPGAADPVVGVSEIGLLFV
jgi:hypothetical protein